LNQELHVSNKNRHLPSKGGESKGSGSPEGQGQQGEGGFPKLTLSTGHCTHAPAGPCSPAPAAPTPVLGPSKFLECQGSILVAAPHCVNVSVIAESWPTWLSACSPHSGFACRELIHGERADTNLWPKHSGCAPKLYTKDWTMAHTTAFISGTTEFVVRVLSGMKMGSKFACALDLDSRPTEVLLAAGTWAMLSHRDLGGVTTGVWWIGSNFLRVEHCSKSPSFLRVGHVLTDTKGGRPAPPPPDAESLFDSVSYTNGRCLHPGSLLPIKAIRSQTVCPGIFSPMRWIQ
jgi:hypothetical protein